MQQTDMFSDIKLAQDQLNMRMSRSAARLYALVQYVNNNRIEDIIAPVETLGFFKNDDKVLIRPKPVGECYSLHPHACRQLCSKACFPISYYNHLVKKDWGKTLICENLMELFFHQAKDKESKVLIRCVGEQVRGFLSNRYALHLSTDPLLDRFIGYCEEYGAKPITADWSDVRLQLQMALPQVYRPFKGQHIAIGMSFLNSDFGAGSFTVAPAVLDVDRGYSMVLSEVDLSVKDFFQRVHLGPTLHERDASAVRSSRALRTDEVAEEMKKMLSVRLCRDYCESVSGAIAKARDTTTSWTSIKRSLASALLKEEIDRLEVLLVKCDPTLPIMNKDELGLPRPNNWWAAQAVAKISEEATDPDRKIELRSHAGKFISKSL